MGRGRILARRPLRPSLAAATSLALLQVTAAFYLPGVAPTEYEEGKKVQLKVNKITSVKTQLPYRYYYLPYCEPENVKESVENLGEILAGDVIETSSYEMKMKEDVQCKILCEKKLDTDKRSLFKEVIDDEYQVNWLIDNLPAATRYEVNRGAQKDFYYTNGFPVGSKAGGKHYLHNHVDIVLKYHQPRKGVEKYRIVGFEVAPHSMLHKNGGCEGVDDLLELDSLSNDQSVAFSYSVKWEPSDVRWASRWDIYLRSQATDDQIHWFSIINSLMIVLFLSGMVAMILLRTLHRDIAKYNEMALAEEAQEETGWKLVHGDVFRKPPHSQILACSAGSGIQILGMTIVLLIFVALGFLSPAYRGSILQAMLLLFTFMGIFAGYTSARFYKMMKGEDWKRTTLLTAFLYPGTVFVIFFVLDLLLWGEQSSGAVPFSTMFALLVLWFGISTPLVFLGAYFGYKAQPISLPVRTNQIPRQIPAQPWFIGPIFTCLVGGVLPFGAVFTELFFIMSSLWQHQFYYLFGFLLLVLVILILTCAEISIALTYFQLASEDYNWWWRSFFASAVSAFYVFLYSVLYFATRLQINKFVSILLYFGYMFIISFSFFLLTGSIGFISTFYFVRAIYGSIKVD